MFANIKFSYLKLIIFFGTTFFAYSLYAAAPGQTKSVLTIQHWQTNNGAQVYFVATKQLPIVDIQVVFDAGSARDSDKFGIAQFTNTMLNQGTKTLTADQIASNFDAIGAVFSASVNRDLATVGIRSLSAPKFFNPALANFINVLTTANFPQPSYLRTQKQILTAIAQNDQQPAVIAQKAFLKTLYNNHPYGHPIIGTTETISAITPTDLQHFINNIT